MLGHIGGPGQLQRLAGDPGSGKLFVVGCDDHGPFVADLPEAGNDAGAPVLVAGGIVEAVKREPCPLVHKDLQPLHRRHLAGLVKRFVAAARSKYVGCLFFEFLLDLFQLSLILLIRFVQRRANDGHVLDIDGHRVAKRTQFFSSFVII
jgi:hypothetical protein